jgi:hypothetical protein
MSTVKSTGGFDLDIGQSEAQETARRLLEAWGAMLTATAALGSPIAKLKRMSGVAGTGRADSSSMVAAARFIEGTFGYWGAKPLLAWRYAMGNPDFDTYPFRKPGESYAEALTRHGMGQELREAGLPMRMAAWQAHDLFFRELTYRIEAEGAPVAYALRVVDEEDQGPVTAGEGEQFEVLGEIRAAMGRLDWDRARELHRRLEELRREAVRLSA